MRLRRLLAAAPGFSANLQGQRVLRRAKDLAVGQAQLPACFCWLVMRNCWLLLLARFATAGCFEAAGFFCWCALGGDSQVGHELVFRDRLSREVNVRVVEEHVLPVDAKETERHHGQQEIDPVVPVWND